MNNKLNFQFLKKLSLFRLNKIFQNNQRKSSLNFKIKKIKINYYYKMFKKKTNNYPKLWKL